jgi:hypothetical protein
MRFSKSVVLAGILCLLAGAAFADITRISPSEIDWNAEEFLNIYGSNLAGTTATLVVFDGQHSVEPSGADASHLVVFVPPGVTAVAGQHSFVVQAVDGAGIRTYGPVAFTVRARQTDPGGPPVLALPESVNEQAFGPNGATVSFEAYATDADGPVPVTCSPASGSTFQLGFTTVQCSATNTAGTSSGSFNVFVIDLTPPVVTVPANIVTGDPVVTFTATATDAVAGSVPVTCSPASGSTFAQGTTSVRCFASDNYANLGEARFNVTVTGGAPPLELPGDIVEEATGPGGAVVTFTASAGDGSPVTCTPASGSTFAVGATTVSCSATNSAGTTTGSFTITVIDTTPPVITAPSLLEVEATSAAGAIATYVVTATDLVNGDVPVSCNPVSGSQFAMGATEVVCTAVDAAGNGDITSFQVIVKDTTAPTVVSISVTPNVLWPPDHKMVNATVSATLVDAVDPAATWKIVSVSSNQPTQGTGDGDTPIDWNITGPATLQLRSEWSQGKERIYTITIETRDAAGNVGSATVQVKVTSTKGKPTLR